MKTKVLVSFFLMFYALPALAADVQPRLVTVTGEGEASVVPDQVMVNLTVESYDADLAKAKTANDEAIRQVLALVKKYNVADKDFQTDNFSVRPDDQYFNDAQGNQKRSRRGYFVSKNVAILVRETTQFEPLYSEAMAAGVNNISGVSFQTSELEKLKERARNDAVVSAKMKAEKLVAPLGAEIARPYSISENASYDGPRPMMQMAMKAESADSSAPTVALGQIKVTASVTVSFELK